MLNFFSGSWLFFWAVAAVATVPLIIHLLNRRRFRIIQWAAMDFLKEAVRRNRRIVELRDLLLLALRTACLILFGLALARPYFESTATTRTPDQPIHAVIVIDNSSSMAYETGNDTLMDRAKEKAKEFIDRLPKKSLISIRPLCGPQSKFSSDAYQTKEDAKEALDKIEVVSRNGSVSDAISLVKKAVKKNNQEKMGTRVVFISDQLKETWSGTSLEELKSIREIQVVNIVPSQEKERDNVWISDFEVQDRVADVDTTTLFTAIVQHRGSKNHDNLQVKLSIGQFDDTGRWNDQWKEVGNTIFKLPAGSSQRKISFKYKFTEQTQSVFVPAKVELQVAGSVADPRVDQLERDNVRYLSVPVVASLPVLFVDQLGREEDPSQELYGETRALRRYLAPIVRGQDATDQLIQIELIKIDELDKLALQDKRLVVIAGVESPSPRHVELLREYVLQGGQLFIAAGGKFDPKKWNEFGWNDGKGILPAPLDDQLFSPETITSEADYFQIAFESLRSNEHFMLPNESEDELRDLYSDAYFFRAVKAKLTDKIKKQMVDAEAERIQKNRELLDQAEQRNQRLGKKKPGELTAQDRLAVSRDKDEMKRINPQWLLWADRSPIDERKENDAAKAAELTTPKVIARFTNDLPFIIERKLGRGDIVFVTTGIFSTDWNILRKKEAICVFDRILRFKLFKTLENPNNRRNLGTELHVPIRVNPLFRNVVFDLIRPVSIDDSTERLLPTQSGKETYDLILTELTQPGIYQAQGKREGGSDAWYATIAVNGPKTGSDLTTISQADLKEKYAKAAIQWVSSDEPISLEGAQVWGSWLGIDIWKWLIMLVLLMLLVEMGILMQPAPAKK